MRKERVAGYSQALLVRSHPLRPVVLVDSPDTSGLYPRQETQVFWTFLKKGGC